MDGFRELEAQAVGQTADPESLVWVSGSRLMDWPGIRGGMSAFLEGTDSWAGRWADTTVRVLSHDLAVSSGKPEGTARYSASGNVLYPGSILAALFE